MFTNIIVSPHLSTLCLHLLLISLVIYLIVFIYYKYKTLTFLNKLDTIILFICSIILSMQLSNSIIQVFDFLQLHSNSKISQEDFPINLPMKFFPILVYNFGLYSCLCLQKSRLPSSLKGSVFTKTQVWLKKCVSSGGWIQIISLNSSSSELVTLTPSFVLFFSNYDKWKYIALVSLLLVNFFLKKGYT